jgi:hypothetical protein
LPASTDSSGAGGRSPRAVEITYRVLGTIVGIGLGAMSAFWTTMLTPLYVIIGGAVIRLPVAPLVVLVANVAIFWFTRYVTGHTGLGVLPAVGWLVVVGEAGSTRAEGDLLITGNNWVGIVTILVGAIAWAIGPYLALFRSRHPGGSRLPSRLTIGRGARR